MPRKLLPLAVCLSVLLAGAAGADVPQLLNYQGYLTNGSGTPHTGTLDMAFKLYTTEEGGTPVWFEVWSAEASEPVTVIAGHYSILLGTHEPLGTVFQDHDTLWLEVVIGTEVLTPRKRVASVAYALRSAGAAATCADKDAGVVMGDRTIGCVADLPDFEGSWYQAQQTCYDRAGGRLPTYGEFAVSTRQLPPEDAAVGYWIEGVSAPNSDGAARCTVVRFDATVDPPWVASGEPCADHAAKVRCLVPK